MARTKLTAVVAATDGGTLNWAVVMTGTERKVVTMMGDGSSKSTSVDTDEDGKLRFTMTLNAFFGTSWKLSLTRDGDDKACFEVSGVSDEHNLGHVDETTVTSC